MKTSLIKILREAAPEWVSGEVLREPSGVSRAAISKQIRKLTDLGYQIESSPRKGYRLVREPDVPSAGVLEPVIQGTRFAAGEHRFFETTGSTNDDIRILARDGAPEGSLVCSEVQETGRGRQGRKWFARAGDAIQCSMLLRPPLRPQEATLIPLVAAAGIAQALRDLEVESVGIKWPNDVLISGRKVCGVLCEMAVDLDGIEYAVVGFGLNVHTPGHAFPMEIRETACSLVSETGREWNRPQVLACILHRIDALLTQIYSGNPSAVLDLWREGSVTLGRDVQVSFADGRQLAGVAEDVDDNGALRVRDAEGNLHVLHSGEVSLGGAAGSRG